MVQYADLSKIKPDLVNDASVTKIPEIELKKTGSVVEFKGKKVSSSKDAYKILMDVWDQDLIEAQEQTYVIFLNTANKPVGYYHHSSGGITSTVMDKEIVSAMAVKSLCKGVIVAHNHPSGALNASDADIRIAKEIREALKLFDIVLLDAMIVTKNGYYSLAEQGIL